MKKMNRKVTISVVAIIALSLLTFVAAANDDDDKEWKGYAIIGGAFVPDIDEGLMPSALTAGRIAEYGFAESVPILGFGLSTIAGDGYTFVDGKFYTVDEMNASLAAKFAGLTVNGKFERFIHRLNNDAYSEEEWADQAWRDGVQTDIQTLEDEMIMRVTILEGGVKFAPEAFKGASLFLHSRLLGREGDRQAVVMDGHCRGCHLTAETAGFDNSTLEMIVGAEIAKKGFAARYNYQMRNMSDSSDKLTTTWDTETTGWAYNVNGPVGAEYQKLGNNSFIANVFEGRFDMGTQLSAYGKVSMGVRENDYTSNKNDVNYYTGKVNFYASKMLRFKAMYDYYGVLSQYNHTGDHHLEADVPGLTLDTYGWSDGHGDPIPSINAFGFERTRMSGTAMVKFSKALRFEGSYMMDNTTREGVHDAEETETTVLKLKGSFRPNKMFRVRGSFSMRTIDNPIGHQVKDHGMSLPNIYQPYNGKDQTAFTVNALFTPSDKATFSVNYVYRSEEGGSDSTPVSYVYAYNGLVYTTTKTGMDITRSISNLNAAGSFNFSDSAGAYVSFSSFSNKSDSELSLGVAGGRNQAFFYLDEFGDLSYEGSGLTMSASAWLKMGKATVTPGWNYTTVDSGYSLTMPFAAPNPNAYNSADITINQFFVKAGMPLTKKMWANVGYFMDSYEDAGIADADGSFSMLYGWLKFKF